LPQVLVEAEVVVVRKKGFGFGATQSEDPRRSGFRIRVKQGIRSVLLCAEAEFAGLRSIQIGSALLLVAMHPHRRLGIGWTVLVLNRRRVAVI
jgi:hypothetical protein